MRFTFTYQPFEHIEGCRWRTPSITVEGENVEAAYEAFLKEAPEGAKLFCWWQEQAPVGQEVEPTDSNTGA